MIALVISGLITVYLLVPEAIFRFIFGLFIPTRSFLFTRTETAYRAVLITVCPFLLAWAISWYVPLVNNHPFPVTPNTTQQRRLDYRTVAAALYSDVDFEKNEANFWQAMARCARRQGRLVFWYFLLIIVEAALSGWLALRYPRLKNETLKWISDRLFSAYISPWHPLLTPYLVPGTFVQADILCVDNTLYQGEVSQHFLKQADLAGIILKNPRRFDRASYLKAKEADENPVAGKYWRTIPSQNLYFFVEKIVNINLSYVTKDNVAANLTAVKEFLDDVMLSSDIVLKISDKKE